MSIQIKPEIYKFFADIVFKKTGIFYPEKDFYRLDSRLLKMQKHFNFETIDELYQSFKTNLSLDREMFLIDQCTNNETYFFRDQKPFDTLTKEIIPNIMQGKTSLKIWSCACSTGQEPLSIIMAMKEAGIAIPFSIDATDISTQALAKAKSGEYTGLDVQRGLPITLLVKYFESINDGSWKAKMDLLKWINFSSFNLFSDHYKDNYYDIIFCRNVLIYQNQENKQKILESLARSLKPGGVIIMGAGESLIGIKSELEQVSLENGIIFQKKTNQISVA